MVPVWFCISSIIQYQSQFGANWLSRCIVLFLRHSADASLSGRLSSAQTVKTGWTLLSTGSVVVLVLQALIHRFLPGFFMDRAVKKAGQRLERTEPATARLAEEEYIKDFMNSAQRKL